MSFPGKLRGPSSRGLGASCQWCFTVLSWSKKKFLQDKPEKENFVKMVPRCSETLVFIILRSTEWRFGGPFGGHFGGPFGGSCGSKIGPTLQRNCYLGKGPEYVYLVLQDNHEKKKIVKIGATLQRNACFDPPNEPPEQNGRPYLEASWGQLP